MYDWYYYFPSPPSNANKPWKSSFLLSNHCAGTKSRSGIKPKVLLLVFSTSYIYFNLFNLLMSAAAAAKSSHSYPTHIQRQPTRLLCPWDSPGKNTGVDCHCLLQCMKVKGESEVAQSCPTLATPWTAAYQAPPSMGFSRQEYGEKHD